MPDPSGVCAQESTGMSADGEVVTICEAFHDAAPFVRLPADTATEFYGSIGVDAFTTRDGVAHPMTTADGSETFACRWAPVEGCDGGTTFDAAHGPTDRWLYTVYHVTGTRDGDTIRVSALRPVVLVRGAAIDALLARPFDGTISTRIAPRTAGEPAMSPIFSDVTAPIRLQPNGSTDAFSLNVADVSLPDADALRVWFDIANLESPVSLGDGSCAGALADLGDANPFFGATTSTMSMERNPSMHGPGGHHIVVGHYPEGTADIGSMGGEGPNSMSDGLGGSHPLVRPWTWMAPTVDLAAELRDTYLLHGNGFIYNLVIQLQPSSGGGEPCTP